MANLSPTPPTSGPLSSLRGISERDRKMIADAEAMLGHQHGTHPHQMGAVKNLFWGNLRSNLLYPYPRCGDEETARCDKLLEALDSYLKNEHPATRIDQEQEIPRWVIDKLFTLGVLGMTIPREYGGLGLGITSYNRVLERIGRTCGSTAVLVSAHQSIGCKAIILFGTEDQKARWLPHLAREWLSAFCLSEPGVGSDAAGQETTCRLSPDGTHYILNGEKKWSTSGALANLFTVMARHDLADPATGKTIHRVTALVCTPDMPGIEIFQTNRSKCGIRGTWQARLRFTNVRVPVSHLLGTEGKGLNIALSCLNFGRCTLSAGILGGARRAKEQATKWAQTRFQFSRPLADFELIRSYIAQMSALTYAMDAVLYATTGMLDRHDPDIQLETAVCKVFCSDSGWRVVNMAMQIMGGEGYMTENEIERIFRDSRINLIVEGSNEVMQSYIFAYGGKQLAEMMLWVRQALAWNHTESPLANIQRIAANAFNPTLWRRALPLIAELYFGIGPPMTDPPEVADSLRGPAVRLARLVRQHTRQFKQASRFFGNRIISRQLVQGRLADAAIWLHAWACTLARLEHDLNSATAADSERIEQARAAATHFFDMAEQVIRACYTNLWQNTDATMPAAADAALAAVSVMPDSNFVIPESSPVAKGRGRQPSQDGIKQFPSAGDPYVADASYEIEGDKPSAARPKSRLRG
jgi:alkylation response protein AidB-like acyl-CoA dehydrogenase